MFDWEEISKASNSMTRKGNECLFKATSQDQTSGGDGRVVTLGDTGPQIELHV